MSLASPPEGMNIPVEEDQNKKLAYDEEVDPEVLDSITFGENIKIDWRKYPVLHRKCWDTQKSDEELK